MYHGYDLNVSDNSTVKAGTGAKAEVKAGETLHVKVKHTDLEKLYCSIREKSKCFLSKSVCFTFTVT